MKHALVLFAHGARDPRWAEPFKRLQQKLASQLPDTSVALAFLELMEPRLPELVSHLEQQGVVNVTIVPVFFGQGGHVLRDLPLLLEELRQRHSSMAFKLADAVGESDAVLNAIAAYCLDSLN